MTKNIINITIIVAVMEAMGFQVKSVEEMDKVTIAAMKAEKAEKAVKARYSYDTAVSSVTADSVEKAIEIDSRITKRYAEAPVLAVAEKQVKRMTATAPAKLAVSHRGNRRNGGKAHYFAMASLPSERGIIDENGQDVFGLENGWILRGGYRDYDPELSAALAAMNNRAARYEAYEQVEAEVQGWRTAIAAKKAARKALYIERHSAYAELAKAKAEKEKAEKKLRLARIATRNIEANPTVSAAQADEIRRREAQAMKKLLAAKKAAEKAQSVVNGITALVKDVNDNILMAYVSAETQGLGYWVHERGSAPTMADVVSAFAGKIAA